MNAINIRFKMYVYYNDMHVVDVFGVDTYSLAYKSRTNGENPMKIDSPRSKVIRNEVANHRDVEGRDLILCFLVRSNSSVER